MFTKTHLIPPACRLGATVAVPVHVRLPVLAVQQLAGASSETSLHSQHGTDSAWLWMCVFRDSIFFWFFFVLWEGATYLLL